MALDPENRTLTGRQWTIRRVMIAIAVLAPLLALARYPFAFGLVVNAGLILLFLTVSFRKRRYDLAAWFLCVYPALPLLTLYVHWWLAMRKIVGRHSPGFDGMIGISDIVGYLCLMTYVACVSVTFGGVLARVDQNQWDVPALKRAAKRVVVIMPISWAALFVFAIRDPFGMMGFFFR